MSAGLASETAMPVPEYDVGDEVDDLLALGLDVELRHDDVALLGLQGRE